MKDYTCCFAQYVKFVESIEKEIPDNSIFFSRYRVKAFLEVLQASGKKPSTTGNKAKIFCEVSKFYEIYLFN